MLMEHLVVTLRADKARLHSGRHDPERRLFSATRPFSRKSCATTCTSHRNSILRGDFAPEIAAESMRAVSRHRSRFRRSGRFGLSDGGSGDAGLIKASGRRIPDRCSGRRLWRWARSRASRADHRRRRRDRTRTTRRTPVDRADRGAAYSRADAAQHRTDRARNHRAAVPLQSSNSYTARPSLALNPDHRAAVFGIRSGAARRPTAAASRRRMGRRSARYGSLPAFLHPAGSPARRSSRP